MVQMSVRRLWSVIFIVGVLVSLILVLLPALSVAAPSEYPTVLNASADTYIRQGGPNTNEGASPIMRIQAAGDNRALVRFDQSAIDSAIGGGILVSAKLQVYIVKKGNNWGNDGRTIEVHRLNMAWAEGNGKDAELPPKESFRGTGAGATWNLAIDTDISNHKPDGTPENDWEMRLWRKGPNNPPWQEPATAALLITKNLTGTLEFDVTADVAAFLSGTPNYGWIIKKTQENQAGHLDLASRENPSHPGPRLILTHSYRVNFASEGNNGIPVSVTYSINGAAPVVATVPFVAVVPSGGQISYSYATPLSGGSGVRYVLTATNPPSPQIANSNLTVKGIYKKQYQLSLAVNPTGIPGGVANISGGTNGTFYDAGTVLNLAAATPVADGIGKQWRFDYWSGDAAGSANPVSVTMNAAKSVTANWKTQYYLTVNSTYGTTGGAGWYDSGTTAQATVAPLTVAGVAGTQYVFTNWSGDATGTTSLSNSITMSAPKTATANWKTQYQLSLAVNPSGLPGGVANISGGTNGNFYDTGTILSLSAVSPVSVYAFDSWSGDAAGSANPLSVTMNAAKSITANYRLLQVTLTSPLRDSFIREGAKNTNEGANPGLRIQGSGDNRALVAFDLSGLPTSRVTSATLILNVFANTGSDAGPNFSTSNWGPTGRNIYAYRLLTDWAEGNGKNSDILNSEMFRGTGAGVTYNCAIDTNINNSSPDGTLWGGGDGQPASAQDLYAPASAPPVLITNDLLGDISFDVTADVLAGANFGWLIRREPENQSGQIHFRSKENPNGPAPKLILTFGP